MQQILAHVLVFLLAFAGVVKANDIAVTAQNTAADRPAGPFTFGTIFARGDAKGPMEIAGMPTQFEVKRSWPDGSVKHAVVTVNLPALAAGGNAKLQFVPGKEVAADKPADYHADLKDLADVQVKIQIHNGPAESVSLKQVVAAAEPDLLWLAGPQVREWHFRDAPVGENGKADQDLEVRFAVRYYPAVDTARVAVVVENCHWLTPGNIPYDVRILVGGKEAYAKTDVGRFERDGNNQPLKVPEEYMGHAAGGRWIKRFWVGQGNDAGRPLDDVAIHYDVAYLGSTGLLPRYDSSLVVPEAVLARMDQNWSKAATDIMQSGSITPYFPMTGGREDLGPPPTWTVRYMVSQDPRALKVTLGNADLGASCPVHFRDSKTDWAISLDDYPNYSTNVRGSQMKITPRNTADSPWVLPAKSPFTVDSAHEGSFAYLPYLITGDYFYLEEMHFWGDWNLLISNWSYRQKDKGILTGSHQARGEAWALRQLVDAAAVTPTDGKFKKQADYFNNKLANNLQFYRDFLDGKLDFKPNPVGSYPPFVGKAYGDTPEIRDQFHTTAGWMHSFMAWELAHAVDQGYTDAIPARDYFAKLCIGSITHPDEISPFASGAYFLPLAEKGADGKPRLYQSWKEVNEGFTKMGVKLPTGPHLPAYGASYSYIARAVLIESCRAKLPGAAESLKWIDDQLPGRTAVLCSDPTWAMQPPIGRAAATAPTPPGK